MARSVKITTPIPTWEEMAEFYRVSKSDRKFVEQLFPASGHARIASPAKKRQAGATAAAARSTKTTAFPGKTSGRARKTA